MTASDSTGLLFSLGQPPSHPGVDAMRHSSPDQKLQPRFHVTQRQPTERSTADAPRQERNSGDALFPLAHFKNMYRSPFMCAEEKRKRLHWLEREEQQYLSRSYPWHRAHGDDLMRYHLAAIVIQSEFRAWRARQVLRALRREAQLLKQEELARQRQSAVRLLRQQAKDLLLTLYAQGQYGKTRDRLMTTKGSPNSGPSLEDLKIDAGLWEKVQQLGLDPVEVLSGQMTSKQIKLVLNASSIRNSGMLPQRPQDLGLRGPGVGRLLNAQDSFLTGCVLPRSGMGTPMARLSEGLGELFPPPCMLSATAMEPERLSSTMPLLASATSLDGLDWMSGAAGAVSARTAPPPPPPSSSSSSRAARRSHPSSLRQPQPQPQQQAALFGPERGSTDHLLWRAGTGPLPSSAGLGMMSVGSNPLHQNPPQADAPSSPTVVLQLHDYHRQPKPARPGILKLANGFSSHRMSPGRSRESPERPREPAAPRGSWVLCSTGVVGVKSATWARDLSASADGPLLPPGRSGGRRPVSHAGGPRLLEEHSDGDLLSCAGKSMSRTCRLSDSGPNFNLPRLPVFKQ